MLCIILLLLYIYTPFVVTVELILFSCVINTVVVPLTVGLYLECILESSLCESSPFVSVIIDFGRSSVT